MSDKCRLIFDWHDLQVGVFWAWHPWGEAKVLYLTIKPLPMFGIYLQLEFKKEKP